MYPRLLSLLFSSLIWSAESGGLVEREQVATTKYGKIKGTVRYAENSNRPVYSYFGVQYGRAPEYVFRFRPAEDPWTWNGVRDATDENRPLCMQEKDRLKTQRTHTYLKYLIPDDQQLSENCLIVDVFTPKSPNDTAARHAPLPVIAWIHGGAFQGFHSTTRLWALPAFEDVVLVQIQYRLGLFGFLTTDDAWAPPNSALHDQLKALKWIQANIGSFGGDPTKVTLMGESAGGLAVTSHMLSPMSKGLFHRVFAMSGAPTIMVWEKSQLSKTDRIAKEVNCYFENTAYTSTCLRNKINSSRLLQVARDLNIIFTLEQGDEFMPDSPDKLVESKSFASSVPVIIGVTSGETDYLLSRRKFSNIYFKGSEANRMEVESTLRSFLAERFADSDLDQVMRAVVKEYLDPGKVGDRGLDLLDGMLQAVSDCWIVARAARFAEKLKETGQSVHFFEFAHKPAMYDARPEEFPRSYDKRRADHGDDVMYAFGLPFVRELCDGKGRPYFTEEERSMSRKYMRILAHFARTGSPPEDVKWEQYPRYIVIEDDFKTGSEQYEPDRVDLWNEIIPSLLHGSKL